MSLRKINLHTLLVYGLGHSVLAFGIALSAKGKLGLSPIASLPYVLSVISPLSMGALNFLFLTSLIGVQFLLLGRESNPRDFLQILASLLNSALLQYFLGMIDLPSLLLWRFFALLLGITCIGIGASLTVGMRVIPIPADALAEVIGRVAKRDFGFGKNILDLSVILISVLLGFLFKSSLIGLGFGTLLSMLLTGRVIALVHPWTEKLYQQLTSSHRG